MSIKMKIIGMGVLVSLLPVLVTLGILSVKKGELNTQIGRDVGEQINTQLAGIVKDVYALCLGQQESIEMSLKGNLNVAREIITNNGGINLSSETVAWKAKNQFTQAVTEVSLPKMLLGEAWLGQNSDKNVYTPVTDDVVRMVGGTCTIFQRMNPQGDMLRVATNIINKEEKRAINTFIPAVNADGTPSAVISTVMKGGTYVGKAFVVDKWYISAYEPIKDKSGNVIGMTFVGIPQENVTSLRKAIMDIKVGKTGYVYVLGGQGSEKGKYIISKDGKRDGENIWEAKDAKGELFIQKLVNAGTSLKGGDVTFQKYPWKNEGDAFAKDKIVALTYFEPWDWVIGAGAYEDDISTVRDQMNSAVNGVIGIATVVGIILFVVALILAINIGVGIANPISRIVVNLNEGADQTAAAAAQVSSAAQSLSQGATEQAASLEQTSSSLDEMNSMTRQNADSAAKANQLAQEASGSAEEGNTAMKEMESAMTAINESSSKISKIIKTIEEISFQTNLLALNAAVEAARAGEHGKGFAVVADEVRNLAQRAATSAKDTATLIEDSINKVKGGSEITKKAAGSLGEIMEKVKKVADIISEISAASKEQAEGIGQITNAVSQMDQVTQQNASAAEEAAASSEELTSQADTLRGMVVELQKVVGGKAEGHLTMAQAPTHDRRTALKGPQVVQAVKGQEAGLVKKIKPAAPKAIRQKPEDVIPLDDDEALK